MAMTYNFLEEETAPIPEQPEVQFDNIEDLMTEAERRFAKAKYYEVLIKEPIFEGDTSPMALEVVKEIQAYSRERLSILLGLKQESKSAAAPGLFSEEEVKVLKQVAGRLLKKPELGGLSVSDTPTLKRATGPKATAPSKPAPKAPQQQRPIGPPTKDLKRTGEIVRIPQADKTFREYEKVVGPDGQDYYLGKNGQKYSMERNEAGEYFMRSMTRQSRPVGGIRPIPPLNGTQMAMVAANHVKVAIKQDEVASRTVSPTQVE